MGRSARFSKRRALVFQVLIVVGVILSWEFLPTIPEFQQLSIFFDKGFVSSPSEIMGTLIRVGTGQGVTPIWEFVQETLQNALTGTAIGVTLGVIAGLILSNDERMSQVLRPFVVAMNSVPRIALIPLIVILVGPNERSTIIAASLTTFFTVFFNAYEGGRTIAPHVLDNAQVHGASALQIMLRVRFPYVLAWSFAVLPNALSHGLLSTVTAEVFTGHNGLGRQMFVALVTNSVSLTFAIAVILAVTGVILITIADQVQRRLLHWFAEGRA
jgi:NitT/TauT family transport system permease protein